MAIKGSDKVTITIDRTTVGVLREKKKGLETWNELMLRLVKKRHCALECVICGAEIEVRDDNTTLKQLVEKNGWERLYRGKVTVDPEGMDISGKIGYVCKACANDSMCCGCADAADCTKRLHGRRNENGEYI